MEALGKHILVEYSGCNKFKINSDKHVEDSMISAAQISGATYHTTTCHKFYPWGVSAIVVMLESHLSIHTWPEFGYAAVDLYAGEDIIDIWQAFEYLQEAF